jgi:MYXO-CTERM domain-containing protein
MGAYPPGPPDIKLDDPTIPGQGLSKADGALLKAALLNGPVIGHMVGNTSVERDGTLDNLIVAHEWGHFLHMRLVDCGSVQCGGQSEGWGDFNALMMALREGDDLEGTYAKSYYGTFDTTAYYGLRRVTYSVDPTKNALSLRHISEGEPLPPPPLCVDNGYTNAEVHNAGEVWATMMWEAYVALHKAHASDESFEATRRRMSDYVVAGMMMAPPRPTYLEQRDALLAAAFAADPADHVTLAEAFARRGAGTCAVGPDTDSFDLVGVTEDFEVRARGVLLSAAIDDATVSCDDDGVLDGEEAGKITVTVRNAGVTSLVGATLTASASTATLVFPDGDSLAVPDLAPQTQVDLTLAVALGGAPTNAEPTAVTLTLTAPTGCAAATEFPLPTTLNGDVAPASSRADDVETDAGVWNIVQPEDQAVWSRIATPDGHAWHADNLGFFSDTRLESPPLQVAEGEPFTVSFAHAYSFEASPPPDPMIPMPQEFFDGGVVEISTDGGMSWIDISIYTPTPGYSGEITADYNVLSGRGAFVGRNPSYPARDTVTLDFGDKFAGKTIALRFRVGTDPVSGAPGWDIDDIAFTGITNTPFASWIADVGTCDDPGVPTTSAGETGDAPTTGGGDESAGSSSGGSMEDVSDDDGCGCTTTSSPGGLLALLALLGLRRRRRA